MASDPGIEPGLTFFADFQRRFDDLDGSVGDLYADDANVTTVRIAVDGSQDTRILPGFRYKEILSDPLYAVVLREDRSHYSDVRSEPAGQGWKIRARRWSTLKCDYDDAFYLDVAPPDGGSLRIIEEYKETRAGTRCPPKPERARALLRIMAERLSPHLPLRIDSGSHLESVHVEGDRILYTMRFDSIDAAARSQKAWDALLRPVALSNLCRQTLAPVAFARGATARFDFLDRTGQLLVSVEAGIDDCP
ncbi:MAG: hypothetical protein CL908_08610 [Deltaproteobacteria bacterium]|nr:hypothetical protein [Deltaproteobacteria bacterium]